MKTLGLLGGLSWVSTVDYYRHINKAANQRLGGLHFAECVVYSVDFGELQEHGWDDWPRTLALLTRAGLKLKAAGAEAIVLCASTAHAVAEQLQSRVGLPLVSGVSATAQAIQRQGLRRVGLLGTRFTMELPFFHDQLRAHGIDALTPEPEDRAYIQRTLKEELGRGLVSQATRAAYLRIIDDLVAAGAEGIILGCTELPLLIGADDVAVPLFDTARLHALAAVDFALADTSAERYLENCVRAALLARRNSRRRMRTSSMDSR